MRAPPWCLLRGKTRGSLRYSCRTRELIRQAERRARFQARRSACREVRFRRTGCPRSAAPFFGAEGAAKQQNRRKRSVFPQRWRRAAARPRPGGCAPSFFNAARFFIIMLKGAEGGKTSAGGKYFLFRPKGKSFLKKVAKPKAKPLDRCRDIR